jgi:hypothetical protein
MGLNVYWNAARALAAPPTTDVTAPSGTAINFTHRVCGATAGR